MSRGLGVSLMVAALCIVGCGEDAESDKAAIGQGTLDSGVGDDSGGGGEADAGVMDSSGAADTGAAPDSAQADDTGVAMDTGGGVEDTTPNPEDTGGGMEDVPVGPVPNQGWIGGPCQSADDCEYEDAICLGDESDYSGGMCSLFCDRVCPDRDGENSVTFCVEGQRGGQCMSRCDYDLYPGAGCRDGYRCQIVSRYNESSTQNATCVPEFWEDDGGTTTDSTCLQALDERGIVWAPWDYGTDTAAGQACTVEDPIRVSSPINGINYRYVSHDNPRTLSMACPMALALHELGEVLEEYDIVEVIDIGLFNCRTISGTNTLSEHSFGEAIDIYGFTRSDGVDYILERDWEHNTENPTSEKARVIYEIGRRMYDDRIFNIILTPNYNSAHDNHFHVDLTDDAHYIGFGTEPTERYFGSSDEMWRRCGHD